MSAERRPALRAGALALLLLWATPCAAAAAPAGKILASPDGQGNAPRVSIWYGPRQVFGRPGFAQPWVNVPGRVTPYRLASLTFSLNGSAPQPLRWGPDGRRLAAPGDFNLEIDRQNLKSGMNRVIITAVDRSGRRTEEEIALEKVDNAWPLPYEVDWSRVSRVQEAVQVVDGRWRIENAGLRTHPESVAYDRVVAVGDRSWQDYEVLVPLKVNAVDNSAYASRISIAPGFGINLRWQGHTDTPVRCPPPHCGWEPVGASNWYAFEKNGPGPLTLKARPPIFAARCASLRIETGTFYWFKARVETTPRAGSLYRLKVWEGARDAEPQEWTLRRHAGRGNPGQGAFVIVAHHVDLTVGDITVVPVRR